MLDCKFTMSDRTGDTKVLALINSDALFNLMSFSVAEHLGWATKPNNTLVSVKLSNGVIVHSSGIAMGLVSSGLW